MSELDSVKQKGDEKLRQVSKSLADLEEKKRRADERYSKSTASIGQSVSVTMSNIYWNNILLQYEIYKHKI